jgi:hypothetical protein
MILLRPDKEAQLLISLGMFKLKILNVGDS